MGIKVINNLLSDTKFYIALWLYHPVQGIANSPTASRETCSRAFSFYRRKNLISEIIAPKTKTAIRQMMLVMIALRIGLHAVPLRKKDMELTKPAMVITTKSSMQAHIKTFCAHPCLCNQVVW